MKSPRTITCCVLVVLAVCAASAWAQNVSQNFFDLNGSAGPQPTGTYPGGSYTWPTDSSCLGGGPCDYWNMLNGTGNTSTTGGVGANSAPGQSSVRTFVLGTANTDSFQGGGSKDPNDLSQWAYSSSPTPNKDTLNAGYAAAYNVGGDFDVVFGADRLSPNGDANIGIWFFQEDVGLSGGHFVVKGTNTLAHHVNGDVLILSAFTNGGGTSTVSVYAWNTACTSAVKNAVPGPTPQSCAAQNLEIIFNNASGSCASAGAYACAITNGSAIPATWASYSGNQLASPLFFAGDFDVTQSFKNAGFSSLPCFASFLEETRSSQSPTAVLKDFLLADFPVCSLSITKSCGTTSLDAAGTTATFNVGGTVTNTGIGTLYNVTVSDVITGGPTNTITIGTLNAGASSPWSDSTTSTTSTSETDQASVTGASTPGAPATVQASSNSITCTVPVTNSLTVSKACSTSLVASGGASGDVHVVVSYSGQVCNKGQSKVTNVNLADYPDNSSTPNGSFGPYSLDPGACQSYSGSYTPNSIDGGNGTSNGRYSFNDLIVINSATPQFGSLSTTQILQGGTTIPVYNDAPASCPICPAAACPQ